jgi:chemotaxis protein CheZ
MPERAPKRAHPAQRPATRPKLRLSQEYAALEATLSGTPLGRWFLAEYVRRNRTPETQLMLDAIARLESAVLKPQRQAGFASIIAELVEISDTIARTRREIAQLRPPQAFDKQIGNATEELDQIVEATEKATSEILSAAEDVQEVAWTLRERGVDTGFCDQLDQRAIDIYTACSFQDITGQRTAKVVRALRHIERRINAMIGIWGKDGVPRQAATAEAATEPGTDEDSALLNGPSREGEGLAQDDIDEMLSRGHASASEAEREDQEAAEGQGDAGFERPEPLTLSDLHAVKRAALFG